MSQHNGNGLATADQIRAAGEAPKRRFTLLNPLPVNGLQLRIRSLTEREVSAYQMEAMSQRQQGAMVRGRLEDASRRLFVRCIVDGDGNPMLTREDVDTFANWDAADTNYLYDECAKFCGINRTDIEDLAKNSERMDVDDSPSGAPSE